MKGLGLVSLMSFVLMSVACSSHKSVPQAGMSLEERRQLNDIVVNHEFYSGCVTEEIADLKAEFCDSQNQCSQSHSDNKVNEQDFTGQLDYQTWLKIYKACIANTL
ncbi:MAG: hypothetical protein ACPGUE_19370 [Marinomonas sp.]